MDKKRRVCCGVHREEGTAAVERSVGRKAEKNDKLGCRLQTSPMHTQMGTQWEWEAEMSVDKGLQNDLWSCTE